MTDWIVDEDMDRMDDSWRERRKGDVRLRCAKAGGMKGISPMRREGEKGFHIAKRAVP